MVINPLEFLNIEKYIEYLRLAYRVKKVYPYAKFSAERLVVLNQKLSEIKSKRGKRKYTRHLQRFVEEELTPKLKKLTYTEGKILIKLIYRQTGLTCYELVKEYRNSFQAIIFQTTARLFKMSLKTEYQPESNHEDFLIEDILIRAFNTGELEELTLEVDYDYFEIADKWKAYQKKDGIFKFN
ncbi:hypothetical protein ElyMa_002111700 [Elysia marginata]|uniref:Uncharacterized protein n=1 Tax=Elysia marginata TaxID=1093978 RepID=A0AAV4FIV0_9GAST|nr:hypothetical protein ElyMa_002111700 [Elysia marginata]